MAQIASKETEISTPTNVTSIEQFRERALAKLGEELFTVPETAITVKLRGLKMGERSKASKNARKDGEGNGISFMCWVTHFGMIEPKMTVEELADLPGSIVEPIYDRVMELTVPDKEGGDETGPLATSDTSSPF